MNAPGPGKVPVIAVIVHLIDMARREAVHEHELRSADILVHRHRNSDSRSAGSHDSDGPGHVRTLSFLSAPSGPDGQDMRFTLARWSGDFEKAD